MKFYVFIIIFFVIGSGIVFSLSHYAHPNENNLDLEISSLKSENDIVSKFYNTFDLISVLPFHDYYDSDTSEYYGGKWRIGFDSQHDGQIHLLQVFYFAWQPFDITYTCFDSMTNMTKIYTGDKVLKNMKYDC